jgi:hypothetical protein
MAELALCQTRLVRKIFLIKQHFQAKMAGTAIAQWKVHSKTPIPALQHFLEYL